MKGRDKVLRQADRLGWRAIQADWRHASFINDSNVVVNVDFTPSSGVRWGSVTQFPTGNLDNYRQASELSRRLRPKVLRQTGTEHKADDVAEWLRMYRPVYRMST